MSFKYLTMAGNNKVDQFQGLCAAGAQLIHTLGGRIVILAFVPPKVANGHSTRILFRDIYYIRNNKCRVSASGAAAFPCSERDLEPNNRYKTKRRRQAGRLLICYSTRVRERGLSAFGLLRCGVLGASTCARPRSTTSRSLCSLTRFCVLYRQPEN
jgi:hypothetical protein